MEQMTLYVAIDGNEYDITVKETQEASGKKWFVWNASQPNDKTNNLLYTIERFANFTDALEAAKARLNEYAIERVYAKLNIDLPTGNITEAFNANEKLKKLMNDLYTINHVKVEELHRINEETDAEVLKLQRKIKYIQETRDLRVKCILENTIAEKKLFSEFH